MTSIFKETKGAPKVFISYSYDSPEHETWVIALANKLRSQAGVEAVIDIFALQSSTDLDEIMIAGFRDSDKVIIIATREYAYKADHENGGVNFENKLATIIARDNKRVNNLIFVKKDNCDSFKDILPFQFKDYYSINMSNDSEFEDKFKELFHKIWNKSIVEIAKICENPFESKLLITEYDIHNESVFEILEKSGFEPYGLNVTDLLNESIIIWPVVPRPHVNLIHYSQMEVIRVLSLLGFSTKVIIANCGQSETTPSKTDIEFKNKLELSLKKRGVTNYSITFLNNYFSSEFSDGNKILSNFVKISHTLKISMLSLFNTKDGTYDDKSQEEINDRTTLKYISPLFTWSAAIYEATEFFSNKTNSKAIIIAGRDEESQWQHVISNINSHISAIFIPILKQEDSKTVYQEKKPLVFSKQQLESELGKGNIDRWLFQSFTNLAEFPNIVHSLPFCKKKTGLCINLVEGNKCLECVFPENSDVFSDKIDKKRFVNSIYSKIES